MIFGHMGECATTLVVSDVHLGGVSAEVEKLFHDFLARVPELGEELLIAGDLFDFWFEYGSVVLRRHFGTLRRLADLVDDGIRIRLVAGNHDAWAESFLRDEVGLELMAGSEVVELHGHRAYVAHGDGLGASRTYRLWRRVARSRAARAAFRLLHPGLAVRVAGVVSRTEARRGDGPDPGEERARRLARHAERLLLRDPGLDLVVLGHAHRPELREVEPGRYYLNAGDWVRHRSYGLVRPDGPELRRWRPG